MRGPSRYIRVSGPSATSRRLGAVINNEGVKRVCRAATPPRRATPRLAYIAFSPSPCVTYPILNQPGQPWPGGAWRCLAAWYASAPCPGVAVVYCSPGGSLCIGLHFSLSSYSENIHPRLHLASPPRRPTVGRQTGACVRRVRGAAARSALVFLLIRDSSQQRKVLASLTFPRPRE